MSVTHQFLLPYVAPSDRLVTNCDISPSSLRELWAGPRPLVVLSVKFFFQLSDVDVNQGGTQTGYGTRAENV